MQLNKKE